MRILGISDGPDAGAALVVDDRVVGHELQAAFDGRARSRSFPWAAIEDLLRQRALSLEQIDVIAVAGRFSPPLIVRQRPGLRRIVGGAFSRTLDLGVFYQAMLRQSGWGAYQADLAAEWLLERFQRRGFRGRVDLVDIHTALANAAYRSQQDDDLLLITVHPMGDGVALAVHDGHLGQIDRLFEQKGFASLHVHLERSAAALGLANSRAMWRAAGPSSDPVLVNALRSSLRAHDGRFSRNRYPLQQRSPAFAMLRAVPRSIGAASVLENLCTAVCEVVAHHVKRTGKMDLAVAGEVFRNPRAVSALAGVPGVRSVRCAASPGFGALAVGAACYAGGLGMRTLEREPDPEDETVGSAHGEPYDADGAAAVLARGGRVLWWRGGQASRSVLWRGDVGPPRDRRLLWLETPDDGEIVHRDALQGAMRHGSAAVEVSPEFAERYSAGVRLDGKVRLMPATEDDLVDLLTRLQEETGCGALCAEPLHHGGVPITGAVNALAEARRQGIELVVMGRWAVEKP